MKEEPTKPWSGWSGGVTILTVTLPLFFNADAALAGKAVRFHDIAVNEDTGIHYRRVKSHRNDLYDALKTGDFMFSDLPKKPLKPHGAPGVVIFDYDNDGDEDLYVTNGPGRANSLYASQLMDSGKLTFIDVAVEAGVAATEQDSNGVCYGDIDNDGDEDLYVLGTGEPHRLFENRGRGRFMDITLKSGTGGGIHYPSACSMGDVNSDGLLDIVIANTMDTWDNKIALLQIPYARNDHNQLLINTGNNIFIDHSATSGIRELAGFAVEGAAGITLAIAMVDYDMDGDTDIIMVDDQGTIPRASEGGVNRGFIHIMRNDGSGHFTDVSVEAGTSNLTGGWMGLAFADYNSDGLMDMFISNGGDYAGALMARPLGDGATRWLLGQPDGDFVDPGVGDLVASAFGWGAVNLDYDNDGDTDIVYHGTEDIAMSILADNPGLVLQNDGHANFRYDTAALASSTNHSRRNVYGVASGDLNLDGFEDIVSVSAFDLPQSAPLELLPALGAAIDASAFHLINFAPVDDTVFRWTGHTPLDGSLSVEINSADNGNHWASVELLGSIDITSKGRVNRDAIGAVVSFTPHHGEPVMRPVVGGASHASQDSLMVNLGLGSAHKGMLEVLWPGGVRNRFYGLRAAERLVLPEIPCSFDADWNERDDYKECVKDSLQELVKANVIDKALRARLLGSAMRAFNSDGHKAGDKEEDKNSEE